MSEFFIKVASPDFQLPAVVLQNLVHPESGTGPSGGFVYEHIQSVPSPSWVIVHGLGHYPGGVTLLDSSKRIFQAEIHYIDVNTILATMVGAQSGTAYVN